jgi:hypothetical protein
MKTSEVIWICFIVDDAERNSTDFVQRERIQSPP